MAEAVSLSPIDLDSDSVVVEAAKRAEDLDDELVLCLNVANGRRGSMAVSVEFLVSTAKDVSIVEDHRFDHGLLATIFNMGP